MTPQRRDPRRSTKKALYQKTSNRKRALKNSLDNIPTGKERSS